MRRPLRVRPTHRQRRRRGPRHRWGSAPPHPRPPTSTRRLQAQGRRGVATRGSQQVGGTRAGQGGSWRWGPCGVRHLQRVLPEAGARRPSSESNLQACKLASQGRHSQSSSSSSSSSSCADRLAAARCSRLRQGGAARGLVRGGPGLGRLVPACMPAAHPGRAANPTLHPCCNQAAARCHRRIAARRRKKRILQ